MEPVSRRPDDLVVDCLHRRRRARAGRRRARRPHHARSRSCRPSTSTTRAASELFDQICELPEYYPTRTERAILEARGARSSRRTGAAELVELGSGSAAKTRVLLDAMADAGHAAPLRAGRRLRDGAARERRARSPRSTRACASTASSATSSATSPRARPDGARGSSRSSAARSATSRRASRRRFLRALAALLRPGATTCCSAPTSSRTRACIEAAYDDAPGVTAEFNRNILHVLNRELDADFDVDALRARRVLRPRARVDRDAPARAARAWTCGSRALDLDVALRRARGAAHRDQREVHAASASRATWRGGPRAAAVLTDPDELFALSLSRPAGGDGGPGSHRVRRPCGSREAGRSSPAARRGSARPRRGACTSRAPDVTIADLNAERGEALADELGARFVACDVTRRGPGPGRGRRRRRGRGGLRISVCCAGIGWAQKIAGTGAPTR